MACFGPLHSGFTDVDEQGASSSSKLTAFINQATGSVSLNTLGLSSIPSASTFWAMITSLLMQLMGHLVHESSGPGMAIAYIMTSFPSIYPPIPFVHPSLLLHSEILGRIPVSQADFYYISPRSLCVCAYVYRVWAKCHQDVDRIWAGY